MYLHNYLYIAFYMMIVHSYTAPADDVAFFVSGKKIVHKGESVEKKELEDASVS